MKQKERQRISCTPAIMLRIIALFFSIWLVAMVYQTILSAAKLQDNWKEHVESAQHQYASKDMFYSDNNMVSALAGSSYLYYDRTYKINEINDGCYYFSNEEQLLMPEGNYARIHGNLLRSSTGELLPYFLDAVYIDLDVMPPEFVNVLEEFQDSLHSSCDFYFYGYYEGKLFVPVKITLVKCEDHSVTTLYENADEADRDLVCITSPSAEMYYIYYINSKTAPAVIGKKNYTNLQEVAQEYYSDLSQGNTQVLDQYTEDSLWRSTIACHNDIEFSDHIFSADGKYKDTISTIATCIIVSQYHPILAAMYDLWPTYLQTFLVLAFITLLIWLSIRRHLEKSFKFILSFAKNDYAPILHPLIFQWREVDDLQDYYIQAQSQIRQLRQDNQQLSTALDYAASAHAHRREMISHITSKWIAPLDVIQNHANDLREESSTDHKEQHLDTILAQAQMMDAMVMEMLDLSRLEAGKVKLSADQVCLSDLTKQIFEKLTPASEEKELTVHMHTRSFKTVADEGRITQVITLLAAYAIQISPEGKNIHVSTCQVNQKSLFILDIPCDPLPQEVLRDMWNSYIPADASDTSAQTGLGLAFVKAIIELHRGSCKISNTSTGIEIRFELP